MPTQKPHILMMGQTPPPWHGQAVATQILFDHDWPDFEIHRLRMEFSEEMDEVGRFQWRKLKHLFGLIIKARRILLEHPGCVLFYPPASAKWVPFLRDVIFLNAVRHLAGSTVFIFHASGLPVFAERNWITRLLSMRTYHDVDFSLEVAREAVTPHRVFRAWESAWCPCAIEVKPMPRQRDDASRCVVLFVGSLQEGKGVLEILKTAKTLKDAGRGGDFHFRIVGKWFSADFEHEARIDHRVLGLDDIVEFTGQLTGDEKWQAYADADVFFFPTHYASEATPLVIMEALGMGLPVLSTEWAGIPAMLEDCDTATLLPVRSHAAYAKALEEMTAPGRDLAAMRESSVAFYRDRFLPDRFIGRVANAFHAVSNACKVTRAWSTEPREREPSPKEASPTSADSGQESGVSGQNSETSDLSPLPPITKHSATGATKHQAPSTAPQVPQSTKHQAPSTAPQALPLPPLTDHRSLGTSLPLPPITDHRSLITHISISIYLADQNPKLGRSLGISRMTEVVLEEMHARGTMDLRAVASASSIRGPDGMRRRQLPWGTRHTLSRVLTDHLHPLLQLGEEPDVWYFPKGFLPTLHTLCSPSVVTIHDTIVQYYADHFPEWRTNYEYRYWAGMLKQTLRNAGHILTVSHSAKSQIEAFMERHHLPAKEITVTYEPCLYETVPQPVEPPKGGYLLHLASREPHKRTAWLVRHWLAPDNADLPPLHVVGSLPKEVREVVAGTKRIKSLPFLDDDELQAQFLGARGLVFPSEIEGFGLPAIEAYYLGTPVCFVKGTSVEEVLEVATHTGGFHLGQPESLNQAIHAVLALPAAEIHRCGLLLRQTYAATKVVDRMEQAFAVAAGRVRSEK